MSTPMSLTGFRERVYKHDNWDMPGSGMQSSSKQSSVSCTVLSHPITKLLDFRGSLLLGPIGTFAPSTVCAAL